MNMTTDELKALCDEIGYYSKISGNALVIPMTRAEDPERPIYNVFVPGENSLSAYAVSVGFKYPEEKRNGAYLMCNQWNRERPFGRAYLDNEGELRLDMVYMGEEDLDREYVKENLLRLFTICSGDFFEFADRT